MLLRQFYSILCLLLLLWVDSDAHMNDFMGWDYMFYNKHNILVCYLKGRVAEQWVLYVANIPKRMKPPGNGTELSAVLHSISADWQDLFSRMIKSVSLTIKLHNTSNFQCKEISAGQIYEWSLHI